MTMSELPDTMECMNWSESGKDSFARTIGERVRELRIRRGYRSARELAEAIPNNRLTAKVINNIEIGRKLDLTVVELLELSRVLDVAPQQLLADYRQPYEPVAIPGVSDELSKMTVMEFFEWLSLPFEVHPLLMNAGFETPAETWALLALRNYDIQLRLVSLHTDQVRQAVKTNRMFPGYDDVALLRRRAAASFAELQAMARFLEARGIFVPRDHFDHSLTTTPGANDDLGDHVDHAEHDYSAVMNEAQITR
jgi:transcriptional regulator with XRE-family HTH domain